MPAAGMVSVLEAELRALDPELVFLETGTLWDLAEVRLVPVRAGAWLIGAFGALALLLAAVGLYGVVSYSVSRRVREVAIRRALGAESGSVTRLVIRQGMALVGIGGGIGVALALVGGRVLSSALLVEPWDPLSFALAVAVLGGVSALAHWVPVRRAARVDPMVALRSS